VPAPVRRSSFPTDPHQVDAPGNPMGGRHKEPSNDEEVSNGRRRLSTVQRLHG
jgi:hypothetical protein